MSKNKVERTCIVCRKKIDISNLFRIVRNKQGDVSIDLNHQKDGRGCYVCKNNDCIDKLKKTKALHKTYKTNIPEEIYDNILQSIKCD